MSWGISLSGPKQIVLRELAEAVTILNVASESVESTEVGEKDYFNLSVSGYVSWTDSGVVTASTIQSLSVSRYVPPTPEPDQIPTEAPKE